MRPFSVLFGQKKCHIGLEGIQKEILCNLVCGQHTQNLIPREEGQPAAWSGVIGLTSEAHVSPEVLDVDHCCFIISHSDDGNGSCLFLNNSCGDMF